MKIVKCPNCQNDLFLDESKEYITCDQCDAIFINPLYSPDFVYTPNEEYVKEQKIIKEQKPINKKALVISLSCIFAVILIATIIMGAIALSAYGTQIKFDQILDKIDNITDAEYETSGFYHEGADALIIAELEVEYNENDELLVYAFASTSDAKKFYNYYIDFLTYNQELLRSGKYVYIGTNLDDAV